MIWQKCTNTRLLFTDVQCYISCVCLQFLNLVVLEIIVWKPQAKSNQKKTITVKSGLVFIFDCLVSTDVGNGKSCSGFINGRVALTLETGDFKSLPLTEK